MRHAFSFVIVAIAACILGIGSAQFAIDKELRFQKVELGQWTIWPLAGDPSSDPYTKAFLARSGTVWMSITEGLSLTATRDAAGEALLGRCTYLLEGEIPRGRLWTLTSQAFQASTVQSDVDAFSLTSDDTVWMEDGTLIISVSNQAQPGNWLPLASEEAFELVLRIYDTPLTSAALDISIKTPSIRKAECQ